MYQKIEFMSKMAAQCLEPNDKTIVISIANSGQEPARLGNFKDILYLNFDHIEHLMINHIRFSSTHAQEILDFVEKNKENTDNIVVHCLMGESRSAAVALFLSQHLGLELHQNTSKHNQWVVKVLEKVLRQKEQKERLKLG